MFATTLVRIELRPFYQQTISAMSRFSDFEATIRNLRDLTSGVFDRSQVPANTPLDEYLKYKNKEKQITVNRPPESLPGTPTFQQVIAFGGLNADQPFVIPVSGRVFKALDGPLGAKKADLHLADIDSTAQVNDDFQPAKAIIFVPGTQVDTRQVSQISGIRYNPKEGVSYTAPFGQKPSGTTAAETTFRGVAANIKKEVTTVATGTPPIARSVSFKPEKLPV